MTRPQNAYGGEVLAVERLNHPKSLVWNRVTYVTEKGATCQANTVPGNTANLQAETLVETPGTPVRLILNGRRQVILIEKWEEG